MSDAAITFDFHNTLATCDPWFRLEIAELVAAYLGWRAHRYGGELDPTLGDEARTRYRRLRLEIADHGREQAAENCVATILAEMGIVDEPDEIAIGVETLMRDTIAEAQPLAGVPGTLTALHAAGIPLGIVSSAVYHPFLEWFLDRHELRGMFAVVTTSASVGFYKSRPEIYTHTLAALAADPGRSIHVGDSFRWDVRGARRAGMRAVWVRPADAQPDVDHPAPDLILADLVDAAPRLLGLLATSAPRT